MEPYRSAGYRCPICQAAGKESPLREFQQRLVCDECHGLLIGEADYISACDDLVGIDLHLSFTSIESTEHACPRCERTLEATRAMLLPIKVSADVLRCSRDGLWFRDGLLAGVFALVSRRTGHGGGRSYGSVPRGTGLDGIPVPSHAPATAGLAISQWRNRSRKRAPTATPINLYRDHPLACPSCTSQTLRFFGDRYACPSCSGTFVQNAAFESMVSDVSRQPWSMPPATGGAGDRACPVCTQPMIVEILEGVPIDRCVAHGLWFDPDELTLALENASGQFEPHGVRAWIQRLFG